MHVFQQTSVVTFIFLATILQSRTTVTCLYAEGCLPATEVGDDGALEIILKHNHHKYFVCFNSKYGTKQQLNMPQCINNTSTPFSVNQHNFASTLYTLKTKDKVFSPLVILVGKTY